MLESAAQDKGGDWQSRSFKEEDRFRVCRRAVRAKRERREEKAEGERGRGDPLQAGEGVT